MAGEFYIFRELKKYTVFLSPSSSPIAYGVAALSQPIEHLIGPYLPVLTKTVLLPFKHMIVYDGLMIQVNGLMMDVRHAPREVQEIAFHKGLIPYIPADWQQGG